MNKEGNGNKEIDLDDFFIMDTGVSGSSLYGRSNRMRLNLTLAPFASP